MFLAESMSGVLWQLFPVSCDCQKLKIKTLAFNVGLNSRKWGCSPLALTHGVSTLFSECSFQATQVGKCTLTVPWRKPGLQNLF